MSKKYSTSNKRDRDKNTISYAAIKLTKASLKRMIPMLTVQPMLNGRRYTYRDVLIESHGGWWWVDDKRFGVLDSAVEHIDTEAAFTAGIRGEIQRFFARPIGA